ERVPRRGRPPGTSPPPALKVVWRTGPRTRAWDELWQRLIEGLAARSDAGDEDPGCYDNHSAHTDLFGHSDLLAEEDL
ncbi:MAG: hypothetical protein Q8M65_03760, partial [Rhodoglobus sp.]|nr:hypothetical protein [Rhodoglobus sp.]